MRGTISIRFNSLFDIRRQHLRSASEFPADDTINITGAQVPGARSPGQLNFVLWRLILVSPHVKLASYHPSGDYDFKWLVECGEFVHI